MYKRGLPGQPHGPGQRDRRDPRARRARRSRCSCAASAAATDAASSRGPDWRHRWHRTVRHAGQRARPQQLNWLGGLAGLALARRSCSCRSTGSSSRASSSQSRLLLGPTPFALPRPSRRSTPTELVIKSDFLRYFLNSVIVTFGAVIPAVLFSFLAAFAIVRGGRPLPQAPSNALFLMGLAIPLQAVDHPRLSDHHPAAALRHAAGAHPAVDRVRVPALGPRARQLHPRHPQRALRVDAAGRRGDWRMLWRLAFPLTRPALVTVDDLQRPWRHLERLPAPPRAHPEPEPAGAAARAVDLPGAVRHQRPGGHSPPCC